MATLKELHDELKDPQRPLAAVVRDLVELLMSVQSAVHPVKKERK